MSHFPITSSQFASKNFLNILYESNFSVENGGNLNTSEDILDFKLTGHTGLQTS
jgi:hypothetical protein